MAGLRSGSAQMVWSALGQIRLRRSLSQWDPDTEEPETPRVVARIENGCHPAAVVVERLVVEPALVHAAPGQVRGRRAPVPAMVIWPAGTTGPAVPIGASWAAGTVRPTWPSWPSWPAGAFGPSWPSWPSWAAGTVGSTRSAWSTWPWSAWSLAVAEAARRPGLGRCHAGSRRQGGGSERDGDGRSAGHTLEVHVQLPFGGHGYPTSGGYLAKLCNCLVAIRPALGAADRTRLTCASGLPTRPTRHDQRKFSRIPGGNQVWVRPNRCSACE